MARREVSSGTVKHAMQEETVQCDEEPDWERDCECTKERITSTALSLKLSTLGNLL